MTLPELDTRTQNYFEAIKKNLGFLGYNSTELQGIEEILKTKGLFENSNFKKVRTYDGYMNSSAIDVYQYSIEDKTRYCAEITHQYDIDGFATETYIFLKLPSRNDVFNIRTMNDIDFKVKFKGMMTEYNCYECGKRVHWLDYEGGFDTKVKMLNEQYCGC